MPPIVFYHGGCSDGFTAAWVIRRRFPGAECVPLYHGAVDTIEVIGKARGREVIVVDFSFDLPTVESIRSVAESFLLLDHHATAKHLEKEKGCVIDMDHSGACLARDEFAEGPDSVRDTIVDYVEDRDLWRFELPSSREINAAIQSYPFSFETWDNFDVNVLAKEGEAILRSNESLVSRAVATANWATFGHNEFADVEGEERCLALGPIAAVGSPVLQSEICHRLLEQGFEGETIHIAACWYTSPGGVYVALRSDAAVDAAKIAKVRGGGGHPTAAGFHSKVMPIIWKEKL